jgi:hypothetical protein
VALPVATIEFRQGTHGVSSHEEMLALAQRTCLQVRAAEGLRPDVAAVSAADLAGPRRRVRAYYNGDRMAWYETNRLQHVDDTSCAMHDRLKKHVVIARDGEVFLFELDERGAAHIDRDPIEAAAIAAPRELAGGKLLRRVAGVDCVTDPDEASAFTVGVEACYWNLRPVIRDAGLAEVALHTLAPGIMPDDPPVVWEATEIVTDTPPPAAAFEIPADGQAPDARFFPQEKRGAP